MHLSALGSAVRERTKCDIQPLFSLGALAMYALQDSSCHELGPYQGQQQCGLGGPFAMYAYVFRPSGT